MTSSPTAKSRLTTICSTSKSTLKLLMLFMLNCCSVPGCTCHICIYKKSIYIFNYIFQLHLHFQEIIPFPLSHRQWKWNDLSQQLADSQFHDASIVPCEAAKPAVGSTFFLSFFLCLATPLPPNPPPPIPFQVCVSFCYNLV